MTPESILAALDHTDPVYLSECEKQPEHKQLRGTVVIRRVLLAAAAVMLLAFSVSAAAISSKIAAEKIDDNLYELYFEENPTAKDAPTLIETPYMPKIGDLNHPLEDLQLVKGVGNYFSWRFPDGGQIAFSQRPLRALTGKNVFMSMGGIDLDEMEQSTVSLGGTEYFTLTRQSDGKNAVFYYWVDEAHHYVFEMFFNEPIPEQERTTLLQSVRPVREDCLLSLIRVRLGTVWLPQINEDDFPDIDSGLYLSGTHFDWQDDLGLMIVFEQNPHDRPQNQAGTGEVTEIDGISVEILRSETDTGIDENWYFTSPDEKSTLLLGFCSANSERSFTEAQKLEIFRSIQSCEDLTPFFNP